MSYDTQNTAVRNAILAFAAELKTKLDATAANADSATYAENSGKLEGLTLNEVVELIAGTTGLTIQDVQTSLDDFIARRDNPHMVTAEQIGLGLVDNFATASDVEASGAGFTYTATADQTVFTGADDATAVLELQDTAVVYVEINGNRVAESDYTVDVPNDTITLVNGALLNDIVSIRAVTTDRFLTPTVLWNVLDVFWAQKVGGAQALWTPSLNWPLLWKTTQTSSTT